MNPLARLAALIGPQRVGRTVIATAAALLFIGVGLVGLALAPATNEWLPGFQEATPRVVVADDSDLDGLPDAVELRIGSDPGSPSTLGEGVPDGWLYHWYLDEIDWSSPLILQGRVLVPPPDRLPVPLQRPDAIALPTLKELYFIEAEHFDPEGNRGAWWLVEEGLMNPREWDNDGDDIADGWLVAAGLRPGMHAVTDAAPGDPSMTLREKYDAGLNPSTPDSDGDGLYDLEEFQGAARLGGRARSFTPTDPLAFSSRGDDIADGFLVRFGLDVQDASMAGRAPAGDGVTVEEAFIVTRDHCGVDCDWRIRLDNGPVLDPTYWDSIGDGVADAWALRDPAGIAHPLIDGRTVFPYSTATWDAAAWTGQTSTLVGVVVDAANPRPASPYQLSVRDLYSFHRPQDWDEVRQGPWWGGLPTNLTSDGTTLPAAVALRGWNLTIDASLGRLDGTELTADERRAVRSHADPRSVDADNDGIPDLLEYYGVTAGGAKVPRTNPGDPDTDGDGLSDLQETGVTGLGTSPVRRDSAADFLSDGEAFRYWTDAYAQALADFDANLPLAQQRYGYLAGSPDNLTVAHLQALRPGGTLEGNKSNILSPDADGDGLRNGQELFPNRFSPAPSVYVRPATDPSTPDTDGDGLPDAWEVLWSRDQYFGCQGGCQGPDISGWPLDPTKRNSFDASSAQTDADLNLAGDLIRIGNDQREFTNGHAYQYDLHPFRADTSGDGLSDMFAIHWGIDAVPQWVGAAVDANPDSLGFARDAASRLSNHLRDRGFPAVSLAVIDPTSAEQTVDLDTNLLGLFTSREKGTWVLSGVGCGNPLPSTGTKSEAARPANPAQPNGVQLADRSGLQAACWQWVSYPVRSDAASGSNPWRHDSDLDGLPDAWEAHYAPDGASSPATVLGATELTPGSLAGGCQDESRVRGLVEPAGGFCMTYLHAYARGVDPNNIDSDGGGLSDWYEIALGQEPLDINDDFGHEDWDGDGLNNSVEAALGTSPLDPDTDGDGLADGGNPANANAALCLRTSGSGTVPGTEHRPAAPGQSGQQGITYAALYRLFVDAGVIMDDSDLNQCSAGQVMALAEGGLRNQENLIIGYASNPTKFDTSGDGVPDGWMAYWNLHEPGFQHEPLDVAGSQNPDGDFLLTAQEYRLGRPADWVEARDGVWWGGGNPGNEDTDGDADWYSDAFDGRDGTDNDLDNDGLQTEDTDGGIDVANRGLVRSSPGGGYSMDYERLWGVLLERRASATLDRDGVDGVPDFLDRVPLRVTVDSVSNTTIQKNGASFVVQGSLATREPFADDNVPVGNVTVRAVLRDTTGKGALVGIGVSASDGSFSITSSVASSVNAPDTGAWLFAGAKRMAPGDSRAVPTDALGLSPGLVRLMIEVEANDLVVHPVTFNGAPSTTSNKTVEAGGYKLPDGRGVGALRLLPDGSGPDPAVRAIVHEAEGVFNTTFDSARDLRLKATALLDLAPPSGRILQGEDLPVTATLTDQLGAPLEGRSITLTAWQGATKRGEVTLTVDNAGEVNHVFESDGWLPGAVTFEAQATLLPEIDAFLETPSAVERSLNLAQDSAWHDLQWQGVDAVSGTQKDLGQQDRIRLTAVLRNHLGHALPGVDVRVRIVEVETPANVFFEGDITTAAAGRLAVDVAQPNRAPYATLRLVIEPVDLPSGDEHEALELFLRPRFATSIVVDANDIPAGTDGSISGVLLQGGVPVSVADGTFRARGPGGIDQVVVGTNADGRFTFPARLDDPGRPVWEIQFQGSHFLRPSSALEVRINFTSETRLGVDPVVGLRDEPVQVHGRLTLPDGSPVKRAPLEAAWASQLAAKVTGITNLDGSFNLKLPARTSAGTFDVAVRFAGNATLHPTTQTVEATVLVPTIIEAMPGNLVITATGAGQGTLVEGLLRDDRGEVLAGRPIQVALTQPNEDSQELEVITEGDGSFSVPAASFDASWPGIWVVNLTYEGNDREAQATKALDAPLTHTVMVRMERVPSALKPGETVTLRGTLEAASDALPNVDLVARLGHVRIGLGSAVPGAAWALPVKAAALPAGDYTLSVGGTGAATHIEIIRDEAAVTMASFVRASIVENIDAEGRRQVLIKVLDVETDRPVAGTLIVLTRSDDAGNILQSYDLETDTNGEARLTLAPRETGALEVVSILDPKLRLLETARHREEFDVSFDEGPAVSPTLIVAGAAVLLLLVAMVAGYASWRGGHRRRIVLSFQEAYHLLSRTQAPPSRVIQDAYHRLLDEMMAAGYRPTEQETARDIADHATRAFGLPPAPMERFTLLFEAAAYSGDSMDATHRHEALACLEELAGATRASLQEAAPA